MKQSGEEKNCSRVFCRKLEAIDLSFGYQIIQRIGERRGVLASNACLRQTDGSEVFPWRQVEMPDIAVLELSAVFASLHLFVVSDIHSIYLIWVWNMVSLKIRT